MYNLTPTTLWNRLFADMDNKSLLCFGNSKTNKINENRICIMYLITGILHWNFFCYYSATNTNIFLFALMWSPWFTMGYRKIQTNATKQTGTLNYVKNIVSDWLRKLFRDTKVRLKNGKTEKQTGENS